MRMPSRLAALLLLLTGAPAIAVRGPDHADPLPLVTPSFILADEAAVAAFEQRADWQALRAESLGPTRIELDARTGAPSRLRLAVPLLPGTGNALAQLDPKLADAFDLDPATVSLERVRAFVTAHVALFGVSPTDLDFDAARVAVMLEGRLVSV